MATHRATTPLAAYVLHSYDWSESSLIVDLLTRSQGRLVVVAKGAKRPTSNFRPLLLPFHPLSVWLSKGAAADEQGEVKSLRAAEWGGGAPLPAEALMSGFYLNELLQKGLARQDPHPTLFDAYAQTLAALAAPAVFAAQTPPDEELTAAVTLRAFELVLLRELGLLPDLSLVTASAEPVAPTRRYALRAEQGLAPDSEGASGATWVALQAALQHGSLAALRQACAAALPELKAALRTLLHYHLGTPMMRTRQVMIELQTLNP